MNAVDDHQPYALAPGDVVADRYRIDQVVGAGAMGVVFAVTDLELGRRVALKVPVAPLEFQPEIEQRLLEEARLAAQLKSGHVANVLDVSRLSTGAPFVTMELLEGESLERMLARVGHVSVPEAVHFVLEACVALAEVHALGIVHRDVKPDNLFLASELDGTVRLKLLDFGVSSFALRQHTCTQASPVGTPLYMAPEQIESPQSCDVRSDIWSLGAVLYELLVGHPPFDADTIGHVLFKTLTTDAPAIRERRQDIPERLEAAVLRCLARDPALRFQNVVELARELASFGRPDDGRYVNMARRILRLYAQREELRATMPPDPPDDGDRISEPFLLIAPRSNSQSPNSRSGAHRRPPLNSAWLMPAALDATQPASGQRRRVRRSSQGRSQGQSQRRKSSRCA